MKKGIDRKCCNIESGTELVSFGNGSPKGEKMNSYRYNFVTIQNSWTHQKVIIGLQQVYDCGCVYDSPEFDRADENATEFCFDIRTNWCDRHWNEFYKLAQGF